MSGPIPTIAILSPGSMGEAIARLLHAHHYPTTTNVSARSSDTQARATKAHMTLLSTDLELVSSADYVLSIVPPRDALATAQRIVTAVKDTDYASRREAAGKRDGLVYLDLNAISPRSARAIADLLEKEASGLVRFIDGGIIGGPPSPPKEEAGKWSRPRIPLSGPLRLDALDEGLATLLNTRHIGPDVGSASGLKMCFASLSKGFTALAIQSCTSAYNMGVLGELKEELKEMNPAGLKSLESGLPSMPPKAYRWVREMEEIAETFEVDGGFDEKESIFRGVARTYGLVADGTELGLEKTEGRKRGKDVEDVARLMSEGIERRKVKTE